MKNKALFAIFISLLFLSRTAISAHQEGSFTDYKMDEFTTSEDAFTIPDWKLDYINERKELRVYNETETLEGYSLFNCDCDRRANTSSLIVDMSVDIVAVLSNFLNTGKVVIRSDIPEFKEATINYEKPLFFEKRKQNGFGTESLVLHKKSWFLSRKTTN